MRIVVREIGVSRDLEVECDSVVGGREGSGVEVAESSTVAGGVGKSFCSFVDAVEIIFLFLKSRPSTFFASSLTVPFVENPPCPLSSQVLHKQNSFSSPK